MQNFHAQTLTTSVDLLGLLKWAGQPNKMQDSLMALMKVDSEETVKFLQDVLDALFNILMQNSESDLYDKMVFECLVKLIFSFLYHANFTLIFSCTSLIWCQVESFNTFRQCWTFTSRRVLVPPLLISKSLKNMLLCLCLS